MWNKPQNEPITQESYPEPPSKASPRAEHQAVLGPSITIKGALSGEEDLLIEGRVEGEVSFNQHAVTVGKHGRVDADLFCKRVFVEGQVNGNLHGEELVVVRQTGRVKGNAVAPRVSLEDGAWFRGKIDTQPQIQKPVPSTPEKQPIDKGKAREEADAPSDQTSKGPVQVAPPSEKK